MTSPRGLRLAGSIAFLALAIGASAHGQAVWDIIPHEREIPEKEQIDRDMDRSLIHLGPVRVIPGFAFTNSGYNSNVFATSTDPFSDWYFTVNAGARFLVPLGSKMYFRGSAFPSYTWWDKLSDRSGFGGTFDAALLGFFNRLRFQVQGVGSEGFAYYSSALPSQTLTRAAGGFGKMKLDLTSRLSFVVNGSETKIQYSQPQGPPEQQIQVKLNNRTDSMVRGGLRWELATDWSIDALVEQTWSTFDIVPQTRDNTSTAYQLALNFNRPKLYVNLLGGYREGNPSNGSTFPAYATGTGAFYVSYVPIRWLEIQAYGRRGISYSISVVEPYYFENRIGGSLKIQTIDTVSIRGFAQYGPDNYPRIQVEGAGVQRRDENTNYGGGLSFLVGRWGQVTGLVTRNIRNSNFPGNDLAYTQFILNLDLGAEYSR